jgi:4-hydroxy-3-methylbut-2-enyl diphosphate reductase
VEGSTTGGVKKVIVAKSAGFCFGVKRAIKMAFETCRDDSTGNIYTLGQIIHNPQVVEQLEEKGVTLVDSVQDITCGTLIIRSHGLTRGESEMLGGKDVKVVDATCPFVTKAQEYATYLAREGYTVIILGDKDHPEVKSIRSYVEIMGDVITDLEEIKESKKRRKAGIVAQTTQTYENLMKWVGASLEVFQEVRVFNTICSATTIRQRETVEIAKNVDAMLIIGGFNSANTKRLAELASKCNERVYHLERAEELQDDMMTGIRQIGISAGASTPDWAISQLINHVKNRWGEKNVQIVRGL